MVFERTLAQDVVTRPDKITEPEREVSGRLTPHNQKASSIVNKGVPIIEAPEESSRQRTPGKPKQPRSLDQIFLGKPWEAKPAQKPVQVQKKPKEEAKRIGMVGDRAARVLGEILLFKANWQYLVQALAGHGVKIDEWKYRKLQSSHKIFTETMKSDGADNQALNFLTERIIPNFASADGQRETIMDAQKSDYVRFLFNILALLPKEELLEVFEEMRFQFVTRA